MRTLHELYKILWDDIKDLKCITSLCERIKLIHSDTLICWDEYLTLKYHFLSQKPNIYLHPEFNRHKLYYGNRYWWNRYKSTDQRKLFIQKMISITDPNLNP